MRLKPECKNGGSRPFQSWDIETQKFDPKMEALDPSVLAFCIDGIEIERLQNWNTCVYYTMILLIHFVLC